MSTLLQRLAHWARDLSPGDLPPSVMARARLQHLSMAGAARAVRERPLAAALLTPTKRKTGAPVVVGGLAAPRDALRLHAALGGWLAYDDALFFGSTGTGAVPGAWSATGEHSLADVLTATVAANEIAGRLGACLVLGPTQDQAAAAVSAVAAATAVGLLEGLDADQLAHALALALATPVTVPWHTLFGGGDGKAMASAAPALQGFDAVELAQRGVTGPLDALDARDGALGALCWVPLRNAFTGLGKAWLTSTLAYKMIPGSLHTHVAVQGVGEILRRHVKAADKRLRVDQIEKVVVRSGALGFGLEQLAIGHPGLDPAAIPFSMRRSIGVLGVAYEFGPAQLDPAWLAEHRDAIAELALRVEVQHDWERTTDLAEHLVDVAAPLLAGLTAGELRDVGARARSAFGFSLPFPAANDLIGIVRSRPDRMLDRIRHSSGDLGDARLDEWQFRYGAEVRLFTTRGGCWPEDRALPEGSPGWPWEKTVSGVLAKYAGADEGGAELGKGLLDADLSTPAAAWVGSLLGA